VLVELLGYAVFDVLSVSYSPAEYRVVLNVNRASISAFLYVRTWLSVICFGLLKFTILMTTKLRDSGDINLGLRMYW